MHDGEERGRVRRMEGGREGGGGGGEREGGRGYIEREGKVQGKQKD